MQMCRMRMIEDENELYINRWNIVDIVMPRISTDVYPIGSGQEWLSSTHELTPTLSLSLSLSLSLINRNRCIDKYLTYEMNDHVWFGLVATLLIGVTLCMISVHVYKDERVGKKCNSPLVSFFICNGYLLYYINPTHGAQWNIDIFPLSFCVISYLSLLLSLSLSLTRNPLTTLICFPCLAFVAIIDGRPIIATNITEESKSDNCVVLGNVACLISWNIIYSLEHLVLLSLH